MNDLSTSPAIAIDQEHVESGGISLALAPRFEDIALDSIRSSTINPRKHFAKDSLAELAESMRTHGLAQPILVRPDSTRKQWHFELVAGERRWRAAKLIGWPTISCIVRELTDLQALELQVIENLQREDLHPLEEAEGYEQLMKKHEYTSDQVAAKIGKSRGYVYARLKLTALCQKARQAFYAGSLDASKALLVARIPNDTLQIKAVKNMGDHREMSYRSAADYVHRTFMLRLADAPFKTDDAELVPEAGPCTTCPKRTGNQPELFGDVKGADICTDTTCFANKKAKNAAALIAAARDQRREVIEGKAAKAIFPHGYSRSPQDGYVSATDQNWNDKKSRTHQKLAAIARVEPTLVLHPTTGDVVTVYNEKKLTAALRAAGEIAPRATNSGGDGDKERNAKAKLETAYRTKLLQQVDVAAFGNLTSIDWRMIAQWSVNQLGFDLGRRLSKHRGLDWKTGQRVDIESMTDGELAMLIFDCALIGETYVAPYMNARPGQLEAAAERFEVDAAALRKKFNAETAPKKKAKPKRSAATRTARTLPARAASDSSITIVQRVGDTLESPKEQ